MARLYRYIGPIGIKERSAGKQPGTEIKSRADVAAWVRGNGANHLRDEIAATFVIDAQGRLLLADRHSEHVQCAGGGDVLSAGEVFFAIDLRTVWVDQVSNQSTGYCPEPKSWDAVAAALDRIGIQHPERFTLECIFRRCERCGERNIVKNGWFVCDVCGTPLPTEWNFDETGDQ